MWSKKILNMILTFLHLLRLPLWPNIWSIVDYILYTLEKNMCSVAVKWNVLQIPTQSIEFKMQFILFPISFLFKWPVQCWTWVVNKLAVQTMGSFTMKVHLLWMNCLTFYFSLTGYVLINYETIDFYNDSVCFQSYNISSLIFVGIFIMEMKRRDRKSKFSFIDLWASCIFLPIKAHESAHSCEQNARTFVELGL